MHRLEIEYKAKQGDRVSVKNYRKKNDDVEFGEVYSVRVRVYSRIGKPDKYNVVYDITLDRRGVDRKGNQRPIRLQVGDSEITEVHGTIYN